MKKTKQRRLLLTVIVIIVVVAVAVTYILPMAVMAETQTTPPPDQDGEFGMGAGEFDDSTLPPLPGETPAEEKKNPKLTIPDVTITLDIGQSYKIPVEMTDIPENTFLEWKSDNPAIALVGQDGTVQAVAPGNTGVNVSAEVATGVYVDGVAEMLTIRASVLVSVNELRATGVEIQVPAEVAATGLDSYEIKIGDVVRFSAVIAPAGAKVGSISWTLGNPEVGTLTQAGGYSELVAETAGQTQISVAAGSFFDAIVVNIVEGGVPIDTIWTYVRYGIIIVIVIVAVIVLLTYLSQKKKKEQARQRAASKRRKEQEEERRRIHEATAAGDMRELRPSQTEARATMKVSGAGVGAGMPGGTNTEKPERPLTLDDLE